MMLMIDDFGSHRRPKVNLPKIDKPTISEPMAYQEESDMANAPEFDAPIANAPDTNNAAKVPTPAKPKKARPHPLKALKTWFKGLTKKQKIMVLVGAALALLVIGGGSAYGLYKYAHKSKPPAPVKKQVVKPPAPKPTTQASPLTGVQTTFELAKHPVTGIMIENSPDARPQSGLKDAGVVFEAIAEGGITRFLALFQEAQPDYIGPVRSSRPYYLDWLMPFDAAYAHVGGSPDALAQIKSLGVKDLDQFYNSAYYQRISQRYAPHNVYTSMAKLDQAKTAKGYTTSTFTGFERKPEAASPQPTAKTIDFAISGALYNAHYDYDPPTNSYKRSEGGKPHVDEKSGAQLSPKVVIALTMSRGIAADGTHTQYNTVGSGTAFVFQDGVMTQGTWQKSDRKKQFSFTDSAGKVLKLDPGQTWITVVDNAASVVYKP
jgi:hypothetical protein